MTRAEHLLTIAVEEAAEVTQRVCKAQRFGLQQVQQDADDKPEQNPMRLTNQERIQEEFADLVAVLEMIDPGLVTVTSMQIAAKRDKVERYLCRSERCGTLAPAAGEEPSK